MKIDNKTMNRPPKRIGYLAVKTKFRSKFPE